MVAHIHCRPTVQHQHGLHSVVPQSPCLRTALPSCSQPRQSNRTSRLLAAVRAPGLDQQYDPTTLQRWDNTVL